MEKAQLELPVKKIMGLPGSLSLMEAMSSRRREMTWFQNVTSGLMKMVKTQEIAYAAISEISNVKKSFNAVAGGSKIEINKGALFHRSEEDDEENHDDGDGSESAKMIGFFVFTDTQPFCKEGNERDGED